MNKSVQQIYGNRVRTRVCGLALKDDLILLVNHGLLFGHDFWAPPGGGVEFGNTIEFDLKREFVEETGLKINIRDLRFTCEFIQPPLHAIELFFNVDIISGQLLTGSDPETGKNDQVITNVRYISFLELNQMPDNHKHGIFMRAKSIENLQSLQGYLKI
ncbi:NUDIX hydrolase [soil metagenome]